MKGSGCAIPPRQSAVTCFTNAFLYFNARARLYAIAAFLPFSPYVRINIHLQMENIPSTNPGADGSEQVDVLGCLTWRLRRAL